MPFEERHIWHDPPTRQELEAMAAQLPGGAKDLLGRRSRRFRELGVNLDGLDEQALLDLLAREPKLLRRPIVTDGRRVVVGFDAEALARMVAGHQA